MGLLFDHLLHFNCKFVIPSNPHSPRYFHIPLFFDCELVQKRSGIGRRLALIGENEFVKFTEITSRPFP